MGEERRWGRREDGGGEKTERGSIRETVVCCVPLVYKPQNRNTYIHTYKHTDDPHVGHTVQIRCVALYSPMLCTGSHHPRPSNMPSSSFIR